MIYLYLKTHKKTGLKYLGKTIKNPFEYKGSGNFWINHLKKYGNDVDTQILFQTEDKELFRKVAKEFSIKYNIVESKEFANLTIEEGQGGQTRVGIKHTTETKLKIANSKKGRPPSNLGIKHTTETKEKIATAHIGKKHSEDTKKKMSEKRKGIIFSPETCEKIRQSKLGKKRKEFSKEHIEKLSLLLKGIKRKPLSEETKKKISDTLKKRNLHHV